MTVSDESAQATTNQGIQRPRRAAATAAAAATAQQLQGEDYEQSSLPSSVKQDATLHVPVQPPSGDSAPNDSDSVPPPVQHVLRQESQASHFSAMTQVSAMTQGSGDSSNQPKLGVPGVRRPRSQATAKSGTSQGPTLSQRRRQHSPPPDQLTAPTRPPFQPVASTSASDGVSMTESGAQLQQQLSASSGPHRTYAGVLAGHTQEDSDSKPPARVDLKPPPVPSPARVDLKPPPIPSDPTGSSRPEKWQYFPYSEQNVELEVREPKPELVWHDYVSFKRFNLRSNPLSLLDEHAPKKVKDSILTRKLFVWDSGLQKYIFNKEQDLLTVGKFKTNQWQLENTLFWIESINQWASDETLLLYLKKGTDVIVRRGLETLEHDPIMREAVNRLKQADCKFYVPLRSMYRNPSILITPENAGFFYQASETWEDGRPAHRRVSMKIHADYPGAKGTTYVMKDGKPVDYTVQTNNLKLYRVLICVGNNSGQKIVQFVDMTTGAVTSMLVYNGSVYATDPLMNGMVNSRNLILLQFDIVLDLTGDTTIQMVVDALGIPTKECDKAFPMENLEQARATGEAPPKDFVAADFEEWCPVTSELDEDTIKRLEQDDEHYQGVSYASAAEFTSDSAGNPTQLTPQTEIDEYFSYLQDDATRLQKRARGLRIKRVSRRHRGTWDYNDRNTSGPSVPRGKRNGTQPYRVPGPTQVLTPVLLETIPEVEETEEEDLDELVDSQATADKEFQDWVLQLAPPEQRTEEDAQRILQHLDSKRGRTFGVSEVRPGRWEAKISKSSRLHPLKVIGTFDCQAHANAAKATADQLMSLQPNIGLTELRKLTWHNVNSLTDGHYQNQLNAMENVKHHSRRSASYVGLAGHNAQNQRFAEIDGVTVELPRGVYLDPRNQKPYARIKFLGGNKKLGGCYDTVQQAECAYLAALAFLNNVENPQSLSDAEKKEKLSEAKVAALAAVNAMTGGQFAQQRAAAQQRFAEIDGVTVELPRGVYLHAESRKPYAQVDFLGGTKKLGTYDTVQQAECAYLAASAFLNNVENLQSLSDAEKKEKLNEAKVEALAAVNAMTA
ncbi:MAG: hypothetical protein SGILL_004890 [Bacillariaceae sp.]